MKPLAPNTLIQNRYLVVQLIGKGGMGEVYLAVDQRLGSAIALKRTFFADDDNLGNAFEREARILARLRHPVLPKVSDHFAENGEQYLIMEHISGDDLSKRLEAAQKPFPASWVLFWADQLLDALSYLHSHEPPIIHRDIKPQNLKLTDENHIVLLDFGLSKSSTGNTNVHSGGSSGSVVGYTPHYAPMEQIRGTGTDPRSDLYSLSATLYQLLTNVIPADALTRADALLNGMSDPVGKISDISPEISSDVSDVLLKGMEVSQEKRYATAREMQKALRKAFTAMQEAMSANTVAFNSQDVSAMPGANAPSTGTGAVASYGAGNTLPNNVPSDPVPASGSYGNSANTGSSYPGEPDSQVRQADVKTEVYRAGDSPLISAGFDTPSSSTPYTSEPAPPVEDFRPTENIQGGFSPDATVPLISVDQSALASSSQAGSPEFFTTPNVGNANDTFASSPSDPPSGQTSQASAPVAVAAAPAKKKSSSSKLIVALAALGLLFVLGLGAAGGGWYYYENFYLAQPTPTPEITPEPSLSPTPSPEPSVDVITNSNSDNTNLSNTNSNSSNSNSLTVEPTPVPTPFPNDTPGQTRPTPQQRETPVRPPRTPVPRVTPKPQVTKPPILQ